MFTEEELHPVLEWLLSALASVLAELEIWLVRWAIGGKFWGENSGSSRDDWIDW